MRQILGNPRGGLRTTPEASQTRSRTCCRTLPGGGRAPPAGYRGTTQHPALSEGEYEYHQGARILSCSMLNPPFAICRQHVTGLWQFYAPAPPAKHSGAPGHDWNGNASISG